MSDASVIKPKNYVSKHSPETLPPTPDSMLNLKLNELIFQSNYVSRDLSWLKFNYRVLDQAADAKRTVFERLKFLAITASNFDEFFMIRVGSLYNYIDYNKERIDYSGLREKPFRTTLFNEAHMFFAAQQEVYSSLQAQFEASDFGILTINDLSDSEKENVARHFQKTIYPMLTPMMVDTYHTFPIVANKVLAFGVVTQSKDDSKNPRRLSFVQIPQNLPRFYEIDRTDQLVFLPIEEIIRWQMQVLFKNIEILSINLFRIIRNGDISIEESDDIETDFAEEVRRKLNSRRTGRVVRIEVEDNYSSFMMKMLKSKWEIDYDNIFVVRHLIDFTGLGQIGNHIDFKDKIPASKLPVAPLSAPKAIEDNLFETLQQQDILLHHPYNNMEPVVELLEKAAQDPLVLSIKITIYRVAKDSRITYALLKAAENGKYVAVLFEVKARFDEENNIHEAKKLQKAGCFVVYGFSSYKTHTKLLLIVRKEGEKVTRYVHMSSGNYNEQTARFYTDIGLLTTNEVYGNDVSEFFNVITGHSDPDQYQYLITAPRDMRNTLTALINQEAQNARQGLPAGIMIKINSLEDRFIIDELYKASQAGVQIKLVVRGICCLRPGRAGISENIEVRSIVGDYLEHTRIYYFHNNQEPKIYGGSADMMTRSFDRRIESLFLIADETLKKEVINILDFNLKDNANSYVMNESGDYTKQHPKPKQPLFNLQEQFYSVSQADIQAANLF